MKTSTLKLCLILLSPVLTVNLYASELRIYFIDVDQADLALIVAPSGNTLLIDSGKNDMGDRIRAVMNEAEVSEINHYVTTHYYREDHYGGIDDVVNTGVTVEHSYDRGDKEILPTR